jgi:hypothetical protein
MKLFSQLLEQLKATPLARRLEGNISEGMAHGLLLFSFQTIIRRKIETYTGPHVAPKEIM